MNDRDRLIELITNADTYDSYECKLCTKKDTSCIRCGAEKLTDHLLANGVIIQKQGEWKVHQNNEYWHYDCPFCDDGYATKGKDNTPPNYCGNCGAKLKEREGK